MPIRTQLLKMGGSGPRKTHKIHAPGHQCLFIVLIDIEYDCACG